MIFCQQVIFFIIVRFNSGGSRGRVQGVCNPLSDLALVWDWYLTLFHWLIFFRKCTLHFATRLNSTDVKKCNCFWPSLACDESTHISDERLSGLALMHLHHDLDIDEICTITRGGCSKGASFTSSIQIHSKGPRNNVQGDSWEGVWGRSNLPQTKVWTPPPPFQQIQNSWIHTCLS